MNRADPTAHRLLPGCTWPRDGVTVCIVVTPGSGDGRAHGVARRLARLLRRRGSVVTIQAFGDLPSLIGLGEERRPGFLRDLLRRGRRDPERGRAARPTTPDPVRADPQRLRQSVRQRLRPFVLSPRGPRDCWATARSGWWTSGLAGDELFLSHKSYGFIDQVQERVEEGRRQPRDRTRRLLAYYWTAVRAVWTHAADPALRGGGRRGRRRTGGAGHGGERGDVPRLPAADPRRLADRRALRRVRDPPHLQARTGLAPAPAQAAPARPLERRLPLSRAHRRGRQRRGPRDAAGGAAGAAPAAAPGRHRRRSSGVRSRSRRRYRSRRWPEARRASRASPWTRARAGRCRSTRAAARAARS